MSGFLVFGIEMSCDEIGIGIVCGWMLLLNMIVLSMDEYVRYGGVVLEVVVCVYFEVL